MTVRRTISVIAVLVAVVFVVVAALTPLRADRIAALDAEAERLGRLWIEDQGNEALAEESNEFFARARELEPVLPAPVAGGAALLAAAVAVGTWPPRRDEDEEAADATTAGPAEDATA